METLRTLMPCTQKTQSALSAHWASCVFLYAHVRYAYAGVMLTSLAFLVMPLYVSAQSQADTIGSEKPSDSLFLKAGRPIQFRVNKAIVSRKDVSWLKDTLKPTIMNPGELKKVKIRTASSPEGPLRFTVRLVQSPRMVCGVRVVEHRQITLDKGSNFCKMMVSYSPPKQGELEGVSVSLCSGVVLQPEDRESYVLGQNYVSYTDPTDQPNVHQAPLYVAVLFPNGTVTTKKQGNHVLGIVSNYDLKPYTYYFGSAWAKYDVRTEEEWKARIEWYLRSLQQPLKVTVKG